jgi:hypothetical protein
MPNARRDQAPGVRKVEDLPERRRDQINFRCSPDLKARIERCAAECDMSMSAWCSFVVEAGCDMHEAERDAPDEPEVGEGEGTAEPEPEEEEPTDWDEYDRQVQEAAKAERSRVLAEQAERNARTLAGKPRAANVRPRECPHLPSMRRGGRCGNCGLVLPGSGRMSGLGLGQRTGRI